MSKHWPDVWKTHCNEGHCDSLSNNAWVLLFLITFWWLGKSMCCSSGETTWEWGNLSSWYDFQTELFCAWRSPLTGLRADSTWLWAPNSGLFFLCRLSHFLCFLSTPPARKLVQSPWPYTPLPGGPPNRSPYFPAPCHFQECCHRHLSCLPSYFAYILPSCLYFFFSFLLTDSQTLCHVRESTGVLKLQF